MARRRTPSGEDAWHWAHGYQALVDSGAPDDVQRLYLHWMRVHCRVPGDADVLLEQALETKPVSRLERKG